MSLEKLREKINTVDSKIFELLLQRTEISKEVVKEKKELGLEIFQPEREKELLSKKLEILLEELKEYQESIRQIYQDIMDFSKEVQKNEFKSKQTM